MGAEEDSFYGYNPHGDITGITDETGNSRATYGHTAYGNDDQSLFTGVDKPDPGDPAAQEPYNAYRYAGKRFDHGTGTYDMGFRDYNPGLNRFLTRDMFNGALADLRLGSNPWTMGRYTFAGGNPISLIEHDGHRPYCEPEVDCQVTWGAREPSRRDESEPSKKAPRTRAASTSSGKPPAKRPNEFPAFGDVFRGEPLPPADCYGDGMPFTPSCTGQDPHEMGCDLEGTVAKWDDVQARNRVSVELRFSRLCSAVWALYTNESGAAAAVTIESSRITYRKELAAYEGERGWTRMISSSNTNIRACVIFPDDMFSSGFAHLCARA